MTESLLGDTERREEVVVLGLSRRWKEEEDSFRLREWSRVMSRLLLRSLLLTFFGSRPRSPLGPPPGGERSPFLITLEEALAFEVPAGADVGVDVADEVRGVAGRWWAIMGRGWVAAGTLTVLTLISCFVMAVVPAG